MRATREVRQLVAAELAAALADDHPQLAVIDHHRAREITVRTVMVGVDEITPGVVYGSLRTHQLVLLVITPKTDPGPADDDADELLDIVLAAADAVDALTWSRAERATYLDANPAYRITCTWEG